MDNQAPTTLDKYICKLVESVLCEPLIEKLSAIELCAKIKEVYELEFGIDEIERAIKHRGKGNILVVSGQYTLNPKRQESLEQICDVNNSLKEHIVRYKASANVDLNVSALFELIRRYLYHCLNSNITNFMSLLNRQYLDGLSSFYASNEEISAINSFINWEDEGKNRFLYTIVSFSYAYCMLTVKKDSLLSSNIFKGKQFNIDTNLIFRMAGINKDERRFVINTFISKCNEVGIELFYSSETLRELHRVITSEIGFIRHLTQGQEPIDDNIMELFESDMGLNDFYNIYTGWCREPQNKYNDFLSFQRYLNELIHEVISNLKYVEIPNYAVESKNDGYQQKFDSLKKFKEENRKRRPPSKESVKTDINNVLYTLSLRKTSKEQNLWQTKEFFVSTDQYLVEWAQTELSGVPLVVIPSVWLSIILRFTGRSADDYKTFCLFLNLRHHKTDDDMFVNPAILLPILAKKTVDKNIKEKIIFELISNCSQYTLTTKEDYIQAADKAFDKYLDEVKADNAQQLALEAKRHAKKLEDENQSAELNIQSAREETIEKISRNIAAKKVQHWEDKLFISHLLWFISIILWLGSILVFCLNGSLYIPKIFITMNMTWDFIKWLGVAIGVVFTCVGGIIKYLGSVERERVLYRKYYKINKENAEAAGKY